MLRGFGGLGFGHFGRLLLPVVAVAAEAAPAAAATLTLITGGLAGRPVVILFAPAPAAAPPTPTAPAFIAALFPVIAAVISVLAAFLAGLHHGLDDIGRFLVLGTAGLGAAFVAAAAATAAAPAAAVTLSTAPAATAFSVTALAALPSATLASTILAAGILAAAIQTSAILGLDRGLVFTGGGAILPTPRTAATATPVAALAVASAFTLVAPGGWLTAAAAAATAALAGAALAVAQLVGANIFGLAGAVVATPPAPTLLAGHQHPGPLAAQDAEKAALGFLENFYLNLVLASAHPQEGLVDRFFNGLALGFDLVCHAFSAPPCVAVLWIFQDW
jgi:hypothetical protein